MVSPSVFAEKCAQRCLEDKEKKSVHASGSLPSSMIRPCHLNQASLIKAEPRQISNVLGSCGEVRWR